MQWSLQTDIESSKNPFTQWAGVTWLFTGLKMASEDVSDATTPSPQLNWDAKPTAAQFFGLMEHVAALKRLHRWRRDDLIKILDLSDD